MGSPIKSMQYERKQIEPNKKKSKMSLISDRNLIFYSLLAGLIILSFFLIFKYSLLLPSLDARIFESFIQVVGILLGFTVVGIFYYLGKIDDQKHDFIN